MKWIVQPSDSLGGKVHSLASVNLVSFYCDVCLIWRKGRPLACLVCQTVLPADDGRMGFAKGAPRASHAHPFGAHVHRQRHNGRWGAKSRHWRTRAIVKLPTAGFAQIFLNTGTVLEGNLAVFDNLLALTIWAMHRLKFTHCN